MKKYRVIKALSQVTPEKGFQCYSHGDLVELDDADAQRMIAAGIVEPGESPEKVERAEQTKSRELSGIETADIQPATVEKAVKRGKEK